MPKWEEYKAHARERGGAGSGIICRGINTF
jgi:hypothetical protein